MELHPAFRIHAYIQDFHLASFCLELQNFDPLNEMKSVRDFLVFVTDEKDYVNELELAQISTELQTFDCSQNFTIIRREDYGPIYASVAKVVDITTFNGAAMDFVAKFSFSYGWGCYGLGALFGAAYQMMSAGAGVDKFIEFVLERSATYILNMFLIYGVVPKPANQVITPDEVLEVVLESRKSGVSAVQVISQRLDAFVSPIRTCSFLDSPIGDLTLGDKVFLFQFLNQPVRREVGKGSRPFGTYKEA